MILYDTRTYTMEVNMYINVKYPLLIVRLTFSSGSAHAMCTYVILKISIIFTALS